MCASLFNVLIYFQAFELAEKHPEFKVGHVGKKKKKTFLRLWWGCLLAAPFSCQKTMIVLFKLTAKLTYSLVALTGWGVCPLCQLVGRKWPFWWSPGRWESGGSHIKAWNFKQPTEDAYFFLSSRRTSLLFLARMAQIILKSTCAESILRRIHFIPSLP